MYSTYPLKWSIIFGGFQLFGRNFLGAIILANDHFQTHFLSELSEQRNRSKSTKINRFWADSKGNSIQKLLKIDDFQAKIAYHYLSILSKNKHFYWKIKGNSLQKCSVFAKIWTFSQISLDHFGDHFRFKSSSLFLGLQRSFWRMIILVDTYCTYMYSST